jgi:hypothetical protein
MINSKKFIESMQLALNTKDNLINGYNTELASGNDPVATAVYSSTDPAIKAAVAAVVPAVVTAVTGTKVVDPVIDLKSDVDNKTIYDASKKAATEYAIALAKGWNNAAAIAAAKVVPSALASGESGSIGAASIAAQLKAAREAEADRAEKARIAGMQTVKAPVKTSAQIIAERKAQYGYLSNGGIVPKYFAAGGFAKGTDRVPAMLTPGEFIMSKYAVDNYGVDHMQKMNNGNLDSGAVYNNTYTLTVNAKTDANPNEIARAVMSTIKQVDDRRVRGVAINGR